MEENKNPASATEGSEGTKPTSDDATSSETLSDIEESTKVSGTQNPGSESSSSSLEGSSPAPPTDGGGRADGSDTGGPM